MLDGVGLQCIHPAKALLDGLDYSFSLPPLTLTLKQPAEAQGQKY